MKDINSIGDLNKVKDEINGEIIGIEPGAGQMGVTKNIFGDAENIYTVTRKGFSEDMPEVLWQLYMMATKNQKILQENG